MSREIINEVGNKYGRLTVIEMAGHHKGRVTWRCVCDCGEEKIVRGDCLRGGLTKSCGCIHREVMKEVHQLPEGQAVFNQVYLHYGLNAKKRGLAWELTKEDFSFITQMNCHYCGDPPTQERTSLGCNGSYIYNGIDRVDNSKGYTMDNIVPCCGWCNKMKHNHTYREFLEQVSKIADYRNDK